jgi:hypothetical protein
VIVTGKHIAIAVAALALAASATSLVNDFTYDDRVIIVENPRAHSLGEAAKAAGQTYWPQRNGAALYRPVTIALFALEWSTGGGSPRFFHVVSVALYVLVSVGVFSLLLILAAAITSRQAAAANPGAASTTQSFLQPKLFGIAIAAALFAVHPLHVEAVGNVVGQSELVAALALVGGLAIYLVRRLSGELGAAAIASVVVLYLIACLTKEHAVVLPALVIAAELTVLRRAGEPLFSRRRLLPVVTLGIAGVLYLVVRASVVDSVSGEIPHLAMRDASFSDRAFTMLRVVPEWFRLLFWPARLSADYSPREIELVRSMTPTAISGLLLIVAALALTVITWRRRPIIALGALWIGISLLPVSNLIVPTGILLAERTLFLASIGAAIVVAGAIEPIAERLQARRWELGALATAAGILVLAGAYRSAVRQRVWKDNPTLFAQMLVEAPLSYRAHWANGARLFQEGKPEQGEREMRTAITLFPHDADLIEDLATRYLRAGLCVPAVPAFRRVLEIDRDRDTARMGLVGCLLRQGDHRTAAIEARAGLRRGGSRAQFERLAFVADSLAGAP